MNIRERERSVMRQSQTVLIKVFSVRFPFIFQSFLPQLDVCGHRIRLFGQVIGGQSDQLIQCFVLFGSDLGLVGFEFVTEQNSGGLVVILTDVYYFLNFDELYQRNRHRQRHLAKIFNLNES